MNSGIAGSASNLSLLIIHFRLKERLLDPTGGAKISSISDISIAWYPRYLDILDIFDILISDNSISNISISNISISNISISDIPISDILISDIMISDIMISGSNRWCKDILKIKLNFNYWKAFFSKLYVHLRSVIYTVIMFFLAIFWWTPLSSPTHTNNITVNKCEKNVFYLKSVKIVWTGILVANFLIANLLISVLQFPFSGSSSLAGRHPLWNPLNFSQPCKNPQLAVRRLWVSTLRSGGILLWHRSHLQPRPPHPRFLHSHFQ